MSTCIRQCVEHMRQALRRAFRLRTARTESRVEQSRAEYGLTKTVPTFQPTIGFSDAHTRMQTIYVSEPTSTLTGIGWSQATFTWSYTGRHRS